MIDRGLISRRAVITAAGTGVLLCALPLRAQPASTPKRIIVYGASGRLGSRIVHEALERGHSVTGVSRDPSRLTERHDRFTAVQGDILDAGSVARIVAGADVVVSAISGSNPNAPDDPLQSIPRLAAESLVTALRSIGEAAPRMIVVGGGSTTLDERPGVFYEDPEDMPTGPRGVRMIGHRLALLYLRDISDVRWTFVAPPLEMRPGERTGRFRVGDGLVLRDASGLSAISMEDLAVALIDEVEDPRYVGRRFTAAY